MADRADILRRLDARMEEAEALTGALTDLRDEFEPGSFQWCRMLDAVSWATSVKVEAQRVRDGMRVA